MGQNGGDIAYSMIIWDEKWLVVSEKDGFTFGIPKAESRIRDTDIAKEMMKIVKNDVLS